MTEIDPRALRTAFGTFLTGVTIVTALNEDEHPIGFTANSFTSVSLDPPLLLICLAKTSSNFETLTNAGGFAVNVLSELQIDLSNTFARPSEDRFSGIDWAAGPNGAPILPGVTAWFDCDMHNTVDAGDHVILIGEVKAFDATPAPGLGYARGAYVTAATSADALDAGGNLIVTALIEHDGHILVVDTPEGSLGLPEAQAAGIGVAAALEKALDSTGLKAESGFVYSVYEDDDQSQQHIVFMCQSATSAASRGRFVPLEQGAFKAIPDKPLRATLERYAEEHSMGQFGLYVGNQYTGRVRPIHSKR